MADIDVITWLREKITQEQDLIRCYERQLAETQNALRESREMIEHFEQWLAEELKREGGKECPVTKSPTS